LAQRPSGARISALHTYPVKGCRALTHSAQTLTATGLAWDRHWMFVSDRGRFFTQREIPGLARIDTVVADDALVLRADGYPELRCPLHAEGARREVTVWDDRCFAQATAIDTRDWLESVTGRRGQLVRSLPGDERISSREFTGDVSAPFRFADAFALLVTNEGSLRDLNSRLDEPVPMARFRPNLVLEGLEPFAEDDIDLIRVGSIELRCVKACLRCIVTTTDQMTGQRDGDEPLRTLKKYRRLPGGVAFGVNAIVLQGDGESLRVGDDAQIEWRDAAGPRPG
jgi:uncharacterized protein